MSPPVAASEEWLRLVNLIHHLPLVTTIVCLLFCVQLLSRFHRRRSGAHLLWWGLGVFAFGLGTALESAITLGGNSILLNKCWYIVGALCGGYPLAQGSVFLLMKRRAAWILTAITLPLVIVLSVLVALSPVVVEALEQHRPSGTILGWQWIRWMTPIVNLYAAAFLVGGAIVSAGRYHGSREHGDGARAAGNALIAVGALLPGIGGGMAKAGVVEALYLGEFIGIILIWCGYIACVRASPRREVKAREA